MGVLKKRKQVRNQLSLLLKSKYVNYFSMQFIAESKYVNYYFDILSLLTIYSLKENFDAKGKLILEKTKSRFL